MKTLKPICDSCPSGEYNALFDSINDKQRIHHKGRMSNFYNFLIVDGLMRGYLGFRIKHFSNV